jgi:hypothetical protein
MAGAVALSWAMTRSECVSFATGGRCLFRSLNIEGGIMAWWLALAAATLALSFHSSARNVLDAGAGILSAAACVLTGAVIALASAPAVLWPLDLVLRSSGVHLFSGEQGWGLSIVWLFTAAAAGLLSLIFVFWLAMTSMLRRG